MSRFFAELIKNSRCISRDRFALDFGGVPEDVIDMLEGKQAQQAIRDARTAMEAARPLPDGTPRLQKLVFGRFSTAPELERGEVAAVDGTPALPLQLYSAGQALCVAIGSISHRRAMQDSLHYWSSRAFLEASRDSSDFIAREEEGLSGISQMAYLRYFEMQHGLVIDEKFLFFDGTLVYEWLTSTAEGLALYKRLFASGKKAIGVMRSVKSNALFNKFARALEAGEVYVVETLADHLELGQRQEKTRFSSSSFAKTARQVLRGVFKPAKKAFAFEVHQEHLDDMLRIMAADCQLNYMGHEIPFLLNRIEEEVRTSFRPSILRDRIAARLSRQSEELFVEEADERML